VGTWIIEDDYDSEFHFNRKPIAAIQGMAKKTPVIYVGSFSKTIYPALRLGFMVVPKELIDTFRRAKAQHSGETPILTQAIVSDFITEGHSIRHLRKMNLIYQKQWVHTQYLVRKNLAGLATPIAESAGMHIALEIESRSDTQLEQAFAKQGYGSSAMSSYNLQEGNKVDSISGLVLGFACTNGEERESGIRTLREIILKSR
jgi:GntR family transcriptional regulator/MocR family aminotransferase